ncbi:MAG: peptide ABC transporter ATP-binding protein [Rhodobacteraceae bacterium]|jgi:oligopeptide/dipeptide ABC transporter ATP-binding protein|uniref:Peptide/nickel transport system ATP-binding protein n=1 Tax=Salipiger profundus TaxID=1229727 RepID=A0A1U7D8L3_9RHOB|nr:MULTISPECIES: oligopeptide/dipeptide ABC transporter ATP-binding protein [Salipiger]APX24501.1 peptide/nickel transport system ATP-binding protein [Salipiger profundus]MAB07199.1 peptide ABC transporter ATP-binding protein [Paracoccaceae bacterium]GGA18944.1 ABC transporter ATP-binding protein [Salipiger profundus]SFD40508.1 peptide/nickel transport system ATP-binding protein [Salipiger profundus]
MQRFEINDLSVSYPTRGGIVHAVDGVTLHIPKGRTLGLVGESGCGKSSLARAVTGLEQPSDGNLRMDGNAVMSRGQAARLARARRIQMVFQDPMGSLNPRSTIRQLVEEPLHVHKLGTRAERSAKARAVLDRVGLPAAFLDRLPHQLSGGQRQRVGIARALVLDPELLICDEPVSALDVSVQAQVLNLLVELQAERGLSMLFVSHDLDVIRYVSHDIAVMYLGRIVEAGPVDKLWSAPQHPYTRALISTTLSGREEGMVPLMLEGELPSPMSPPSGCRFRTRCPFAREDCASTSPAEVHGDGRRVACLRNGLWQGEMSEAEILHA